MTRLWSLLSIGLLLCAGCSQATDANTAAGTASSAQSPAPDGLVVESPSSGAANPAGAAETESGLVTISDGTAELTPANTHIGWVGTHAGEKPDPRVGSFEKFTGTAEVDIEAKSLKSVSVDIETASLKSEFDKLTTHLNSQDFFDTREYPTATFKSTKIEGTGAETTVTGDLTMHGVTKEISFPATVTVTDAGLAVQAEFTIDRTEFEVGKGMDRVEKDVTIEVTVGKDTISDQPAATETVEADAAE